MYARRIQCRNQIWGVLLPSKYVTRTYSVERGSSQSLICRTVLGNKFAHGSLGRRNFLHSFSSRSVASAVCYTDLDVKSNPCLNSIQFRAYSSEGDGRNASEDKLAPVKDGAGFVKGKTLRETAEEDIRNCDAHARLGEQDQKEWLINEKISMESRKKDSPFLTRRDKFKNEFLRRVIPWEKITVSWDTLPYYIHEHTKKLLVECAASHLKHKKVTSSYGARLASSSGRILLQSGPGTELYRERLVRALAQDLQVPLLVLDSSVLAPYDFGDDCQSESESDDDSAERGEDYTSESEVEDENEEDWTSSNEAKSDGTDNDEVATAEAPIRKLHSPEDFEKLVSGESDNSTESSNVEAVESSKSQQPLKRGDRVKYVGSSTHSEADKRIILGKISTSDGPTNAYTIIRGRWVGKSSRRIGKKGGSLN